ncbi:sensor histidine kinase [Pseudoduganella umbonata]|uniref:histidine kinase n=1 Tax=Pseudoduganella umbonata TaxID=864828 RepID=A0A4P8HU14_9BURK|nr:HAMP domain-containing sensor histidine kinase [Pseudoduganella umbonata]MBB3220617.1 signal transduction histidine kinase [Pseudoduganella umbonata]QCP11885.1 HAMP domain-containing histidine kinase [Pseudoduganella umbonata]
MITANLPGNTPVDWADWETPLLQFSEATGLVASAFDIAGVRRIGPKTGSRLAALLARSTLWAEDGPGTAIERSLVQSVCADGQPASAQFCGLRVCTQPLLLGGKLYGVVVFGWRFADFSSPLECEQIARQIGLPGHVLWNEVRLDAPVSAQRMETYTTLLGTLCRTLDRQREIIDDLTRVNRTRELFLATVSHEMRTPLSALSLRIEMMLRTIPDLPPAVVSGLETMRVHVRQEAGMVDDLIDAARTLTGQMSITRTPVMLGQVLRDAISTVETSAHMKRIVMQVTPADHGDGIRLQADGRRLQQVIWNLLINATKFTPEGGIIRISAGCSDGMVAIDIADSGQGIEADDLPHVFNAFTLQQDNNATGLGLGLYIARRIVELHRGTLSVSSAGRGKGATFSIRLPVAAG